MIRNANFAKLFGAIDLALRSSSIDLSLSIREAARESAILFPVGDSETEQIMTGEVASWAKFPKRNSPRRMRLPYAIKKIYPAV